MEQKNLQKNCTRQVKLDLAKALAIIFMVFVHTYEAHWFLENSEEGAGYICAWIIEFLGGVPAAPLFMLAMGVGVVYAKNATASTYLKRAAKIFALGILVNFFQQWVPIFLREDVAEEFAANAHSIIAATGVVALVIADYVINMDPNDMIINSLTEANMEDVGLYYAMDSWNLLWSYGCLAIELFLLYLVVRLSKNKIPALFTYMSKHIMPIYVLQWVFIGLATPLFDRVSDVFVCAALGAVVLGLTLLSAWLWDKLMAKRKKA